MMSLTRNHHRARNFSFVAGHEYVVTCETREALARRALKNPNSSIRLYDRLDVSYCKQLSFANS